MKVDELLHRVDAFIGQVVDLDGYLLIELDGDHHIPYLSATRSLDDNLNLRIDQRVAELRQIIQPMHTQVLIRRGEWENPPYIYQLPLHLRAEVAFATDSMLTLRRIESVQVSIPYPQTLTKYTKIGQSLYHADVTYGEFTAIENQSYRAQAQIHSRKTLKFATSTEDKRVLGEEENCYAWRLLNKRITIPGRLRYLPGMTHQRHFVLDTTAVRAGVIDIGLLRSTTSIWWRPNPLYLVARSQMIGMNPEAEEALRVEISGQIEYIGEEFIPIDRQPIPQLAFSEVDEIVIYHESYLLE